MARSLRIAYPNAFYHITSRGNERKNIFKDKEDRKKFVSYFESATQRYDAVIHVYCLMTNHYHILMETPSGNLSQIMQHINGAYTTYFNLRHQRSGHLFQGRYKAILVEIDGYAKELSRYIHLNPVRANMVDKPEQYSWSSYLYYIGCKPVPEWLFTNFILSCFDNKILDAQRKYRAFVAAMMRQEYTTPLKDVVSSTILGNDDFIKKIKDKYLSDKEADFNLPALKELSPKKTVGEIAEEVESVFGGDRGLARGVKIYLCHKHTGKKLKDIGKYFDIGGSGVSQATRRIAMKVNQDKELSEKITKIEHRLGLSKMKT